MLSVIRSHAGRLSKFGVVGVINTAVDYIVFAVLVQLFAVHVVPANIAGYGAGIVNSFVLNARFTFRDRAGGGNRFGLFVVVNLVGLVLSTGVVWMLSLTLHPLLAKLAATGVTLIWNYAMSDRFVFRR